MQLSLRNFSRADVTCWLRGPHLMKRWEQSVGDGFGYHLAAGVEQTDRSFIRLVSTLLGSAI